MYMKYYRFLIGRISKCLRLNIKLLFDRLSFYVISLMLLLCNLHQKKVQAILDNLFPHTLSQAHRFLGKIDYYRKFINDFADTAASLHKVSNKTSTKHHEFYWHAKKHAAFGVLSQFSSLLHSFSIFLILCLRLFYLQALVSHV